MFRIGDFARLSQVSVRTLRFYDERGLLKPRSIDSDSGYRFYSAEQLPRLNRILALKGLGLSLEQIAWLLENELPAQQLRGMLRLKQVELQQHIHEQQARLAQVETRLQQIESEGNMPRYDIVLKSVDALLVAAIRQRIATYADVGRLTDEIYQHLRRHGVAGIDGAVWYDQEQTEQGIDAEGFVILEHPIPSTERIRVYRLPAYDSVASVVHHGTYSTLYHAYAALGAWTEANGWRIRGPDRDIYIHGGADQHDPSYVTEIQFPVAPLHDTALPEDHP